MCIHNVYMGDTQRKISNSQSWLRILGKWKSLSCIWLCDPGILQARILEWVAVPFSRESSQPWDQTQISRMAGRFFTSWATREALRIPGLDPSLAKERRIYRSPVMKSNRESVVNKSKTYYVLSRVWIFVTPWTDHTSLLLSVNFSGKNIGVGCHLAYSRGSSPPRHLAQVSWVSCTGREILYH